MQRKDFAAAKRFAKAKLSFVVAKEALMRMQPWVRQGEEAFIEAKDGGLDQQTAIFEPIFSPFSKAHKYMYFRLV